MNEQNLLKSIATMLDQKLEQKLEPINNNLEEVKGDISLLNKSTSSLENDMKFVKSELNVVKNDVQSLNSDMKTVKEDISSLKSDIKKVKSDMVTKDVARETSNLILNELDAVAERNREWINKKFDETAGLLNTFKLESDTISLLLKMIDKQSIELDALKERVSELEKRTA